MRVNALRESGGPVVQFIHTTPLDNRTTLCFPGAVEIAALVLRTYTIAQQEMIKGVGPWR